MHSFKLPVAVLLASLTFGCTSVNSVSPQVVEKLTMRNAKQPSQQILTGGQPSRADLELLAAQGVTQIINLRGIDEFDGFDEAKVVGDLGMDYQAIPVAGKGDITKANAEKLDAILNKAKGPVLVHCASGNRAGALLALRAYYIQGKTAAEALAFGKSAGLTKLTAKVESLIAQ